MEAPVAQEPRPLPERIGRYEILTELGHGGMAVLYLARSVGLGGFERLFAIKMIHEHLGREQRFVQMFLDEARLVARIRHPNVIPVYEVDVDHGRYYLSMDYISGETLGATLSSSWPAGRSFPFELAAYIIAMAAEGLHSAHELRGPNAQSLGVIHRDISPHNIMLGYDGSVRVMDFGVAKALDQIAHSRPGTFKGTPAYMSPEQIRGGNMDRRSDIFGLGAILWEATVGRRLFKDKNDIATAARVLKMKVPPPSGLRKNYPPRISAIIEKALSRDPEARHQTARQLSEELQDYLAKCGKRVSAGDVESFMLEIFPERVKERRDLENKAMSPAASGPLLPRALSNQSVSDSLAPLEVGGDVDLDIDGLDALPAELDTGLIFIGRQQQAELAAAPPKPAEQIEGHTTEPDPPDAPPIATESATEIGSSRVSPDLGVVPVSSFADLQETLEEAPKPAARPSTALTSLAAAELAPSGPKPVPKTPLPRSDSDTAPVVLPVTEAVLKAEIEAGRSFSGPGDSTVELAGLKKDKRIPIAIGVGLGAVVLVALLASGGGNKDDSAFKQKVPPAVSAAPPAPVTKIVEPAPPPVVEAKLEPAAAPAPEPEPPPPIAKVEPPPPPPPPVAKVEPPPAPAKIAAPVRAKKPKAAAKKPTKPALFRGSDL